MRSRVQNITEAKGTNNKRRVSEINSFVFFPVDIKNSSMKGCRCDYCVCQHSHCSTSPKISVQMFLFLCARVKEPVFCATPKSKSSVMVTYGKSSTLQVEPKSPNFWVITVISKSALDFSSALLHSLLNTSAYGLLIKIRQTQ